MAATATRSDPRSEPRPEPREDGPLTQPEREAAAPARPDTEEANIPATAQPEDKPEGATDTLAWGDAVKLYKPSVSREATPQLSDYAGRSITIASVKSAPKLGRDGQPTDKTRYFLAIRTGTGDVLVETSGRIAKPVAKVFDASRERGRPNVVITAKVEGTKRGVRLV